MSTRRIVAATLAGHFAAAFAALGMPPFYDRILRQALGNDASWLAGWLFVMPTLVAALSNPWWGRLADRYGKKRLLLRAHLGLAASFWLTSLAGNVWQFAAALLLQGLLGGTFAASNAYLATVVSGHRLARLLTLMQGSARAALFAGPALMGVVSHGAEPLLLYRYLALLPFMAALLVWRLPAGAQPMHAGQGRQASDGGDGNALGGEAIAPGHLYGLQFAFIFATVITFPYFVPYAEQTLARLPAAAPGLLFGLPHLVYLLCALPLSRLCGRRHLLATLAASQLVLIVALLGQAGSHSLATLAAWRFVMGVAMTACYIALHGMVAAITDAGNAGRRFGSLEGSTKWGAVAAGLAAGVAAARWGLQAHFLIGAAALAASCIHLVVLLFRRSRGDFKQPAHSSD
ncbi:MFS transporter [Pseudoduganella sp.]|uniref:MFS transporter n=1 Tax=Pseudoduganella sp. TaxID=1880898 RepID=UPI0035AE93F6